MIRVAPVTTPGQPKRLGLAPQVDEELWIAPPRGLAPDVRCSSVAVHAVYDARAVFGELCGPFWRPVALVQVGVPPQGSHASKQEVQPGHKAREKHPRVAVQSGCIGPAEGVLGTPRRQVQQRDTCSHPRCAYDEIFCLSPHFPLNVPDGRHVVYVS